METGEPIAEGEKGVAADLVIFWGVIRRRWQLSLVALTLIFGGHATGVISTFKQPVCTPEELQHYKNIETQFEDFDKRTHSKLDSIHKEVVEIKGRITVNTVLIKINKKSIRNNSEDIRRK